MEENLKQRLVGAGVLVALAVIFLPALFDQDERVVIDVTSQIPPAPIVEPVNIPLPTKPKGIKVPPVEKLFTPKVVEDADVDVEVKPSAVVNVKPKITNDTKQKEKVQAVVSKPSLNSNGVPVGWVIQAASFKYADSAKKLIEQLLAVNYKAYSQSVKTAKGDFFRVLIGPYIDEQLAIDVKHKVDKTYQLQSIVLRFNPASGD